jgi:hypothetical protein
MKAFLPILILLAFLISCKKENFISFEISTKIDANNTILVNGRKTQLNIFKLYFSNIKLISTNNDTILCKDYLLYELNKESKHIFQNKNGITFKQIIIGAGLDSLQNNAVPSTFPNEHPLSVQQNMYWNMLKYRFLVAEGALDSSYNKNQNPSFPFSLHLGRNEVYVIKVFQLNQGLENGEIEIVIDYEKMFQDGTLFLDNKNYYSNHSENYQMEDAKLLMKNLTNGIAVNVK